MVVVICLILFGMIQVARIYTAREILYHGSTAAARARAVGFNDFMVHKVYRVATIPNAGAMESPGFQRGAGLEGFVRSARPGAVWNAALRWNPTSPQYSIEQSRIPLYLGAENYGRLAPILDYEDWDTVRLSRMSDSGLGTVRASVRQDLPLKYPFHRAFYAADEVDLEGDVEMDSHASLYLQ